MVVDNAVDMPCITVVMPVMLPPLEIISLAPTSEIDREIIVPNTPAKIRMLFIKCG